MTLPELHPRWDMQVRTTDWNEAVAAFGFTERQARFLVEEYLGFGAEEGIRTPTILLSPAPQAGASASSATSAFRGDT